MKTLRMKTLIASVAISAMLGASAYAALPGEGMRGTNGELLSDVKLYAGSGEFSDVNGAAAVASFRAPEGVVAGPNGTLYVSDTVNHLIRMVKDGQVTTYAGITLTVDDAGLPQGTLIDGPSAESVFNQPAGLALDAQGNLYVADAGNHAIRKIASNGTVTTIAGNGVLGTGDGNGEEASFYAPLDVAVAADGTLYVADTLNHLIRKIDKNGNVSTLNAPASRPVEVQPGNLVEAGSYKDGALSEALFNEPSSIALDDKGNLFVSDTGNQVIRYIDLKAQTVSTVAGAIQEPAYAENQLYAATGYQDGPAKQAMFNFPKGIAYTSEGGLLIADELNHVIRYLLHGTVTTLAGTANEYGQSNGINGFNAFHAPKDVALAPDDRILVADSYNNMIRTYSVFELPSSIEADVSIHVVLDGEVIAFDAKPEMKSYRTMIPMRAVSEAFGYEVDYENGVVTVNGSTKRISLTPGLATMTVVEGEQTNNRTIDVVPYIKDDRVYLPLRFFSEELGLDVQWDQETQTAVLRTKSFE